jgi:hypothetical protein
MTYRFIDRLLGHASDVQAEDLVLGRFMVEPLGDDSTFLNSVAIAQPSFCVPDLRGHWQLMEPGRERVEGTMSRAQVLDRLDVTSILDVGKSVREVLASGGTWLDALDVSPLVPGMSERAELQEFEKLLPDRLGHLVEVCQRPRTHLRVEVERTVVARARRLATQASSYLAAHTEDWDRPTLRAVIPKRILSLVREDQFDIYENRVAVRLVDHLDAYLSRRVTEVSRLLRLFNEVGDHSSTAGQGSHWRQKRVYQLWGDSLDAGEARRKAERTLEQLKFLKYSVSGLMDSVLYREVPRRAFVSTTLTMTNILANDVHYRRVAEIWLAWARLGLEQSPRPDKHFEEMQELCRCFGAFALLLVIRGLDQLGIEPVDLSRALDGDAIDFEGRGTRGRLSWSLIDGTLRLSIDGARPLRIVPIPGSLAMFGDDDLARLIRDADEVATHEEITLVLYPSPSSEAALRRLAPVHAHRLNALSHEVAERGRGRAGFLPVSPWDLSSVERVARELRWVITAPRFLAYPPFIANRPIPNIVDSAAWLEATGTGVFVTRAPEVHEDLRLAERLATQRKRLEALEDEHEDVSQQLRLAVRDGGASGPLNARKKALNASITDLRSQIDSLADFSKALEAAIELVKSLLSCPTCGTIADTRRDFTGGRGHRFSCVCPDCSTKWGTEACPSCKAWIPTLMPAVSSWAARDSTVGWLDRLLGADVLAVPFKLEDGTVGFVCPSCGHGHEPSMTSAVPEQAGETQA